MVQPLRWTVTTAAGSMHHSLKPRKGRCHLSEAAELRVSLARRAVGAASVSCSSVRCGAQVPSRGSGVPGQVSRKTNPGVLAGRARANAHTSASEDLCIPARWRVALLRAALTVKVILAHALVVVAAAALGIPPEAVACIEGGGAVFCAGALWDIDGSCTVLRMSGPRAAQPGDEHAKRHQSAPRLHGVAALGASAQTRTSNHKCAHEPTCSRRPNRPNKSCACVKDLAHRCFACPSTSCNYDPSAHAVEGKGALHSAGSPGPGSSRGTHAEKASSLSSSNPCTQTSVSSQQARRIEGVSPPEHRFPLLTHWPLQATEPLHAWPAQAGSH